MPQDHPDVRSAAQAAAATDTVLIAPGVHPGGVYLEGKPLTFASWFLTTGDTSYVTQTVLDTIGAPPCSGQPQCGGNAVLDFGPGADGSAVIGLTVQGAENGIRSYSVLDVRYCRIVSCSDGLDFEGGGDGAGGVLSHNLMANNKDDGLDMDGRMMITVTDNIIRDNRDDGIELRLYGFSGPASIIDIVNNRITGNGEDGIQLINQSSNNNYVLRIERNHFAANFDASGLSAAIGCMPSGQTDETLIGAPLSDRIYVVHNTFVGEKNGVVGGANVIALNNIFAGIEGSAVRRVAGSSITSYAMFWNNGIDHEESVVDAAHLLHANPVLAADATLGPGSPAIDAGTAFFQWGGETVLNVPPSGYLGSAPDLGAFESGGGGPPPPNSAPTVSAGADQTVALPAEALLDGTVTDDGLPGPSSLSVTWSLVSGPAPVTFQNPAAVDTRATFATPGTYLLRLMASDGELSGEDSVQITVEAAPAFIERRVAGGGDDAEESATGSVSVTGSDLELVFDKNLQTVGVRFANVTVPRGATVARAWIQFEADERQSEVTSLVLQAQAADNAPGFVKTTRNLSARPRTTASATWSPPAWNLIGEAGANQRTPDLTAVIQEVVNRPGWANGNALVILITGTGHRTARAYEGRAAGAALLHVELGSGGPPPGNTAPTVDAGGNQVIALPAEAVLDGTVIDDGLPSPPALATTWSVASGPGPVTFLNAGAVDTRATFTMTGTYLLRLTASDGELSATDSVQITVGPPVTGFERRIAVGTDDAEESAAGVMDLSSSDLELVFDKSNQWVGLRFTNLTIPPGATVANAYVQFETDEVQSEATSLVLRAQAADNAAAFTTTAGNISGRALTAASASWSPPAWTLVGEVGPGQRTPNLAAVVQEVVSRPGWASGNALVIVVSGTGHRTARAYNGSVAGAALLHVELATGAPLANAAPAAAEVDVSAPELALLRAGAHPARGALRVEFTLADAGPARLEVMDVMGRRAAASEVGSLGPGRHAFDVPDPLPAGVYLVRLSQGRATRVMKTIIVR